MKNFLYFALQYPDFARLPVMLSGSRRAPVEAGLKCLQGKSLVKLTGLKKDEGEFLRLEKLVRSYGAVIFSDDPS
jgi:cobalamin-dependent methionine synthase I